MNRPSIRSVGVKGLIATASLLLILSLSIFLLARHTRSPLDVSIEQQVQKSQGYRQQYEQKGVLSALDYARLAKISGYIDQRQIISDDDLDFWIALLHRGPLKDTPSNWSSFYTIVLGLGAGRKQLTPSQQQKMYDAALPFVSDAAYTKVIDPSATQMDPADPLSQQSLRTGEEKIALMLLAQTRDPRALGVLDNIAQNSPHPELRQTARDYHDKLAAVLR